MENHKFKQPTWKCPQCGSSCNFDPYDEANSHLLHNAPVGVCDFCYYHMAEKNLFKRKTGRMVQMIKETDPDKMHKVEVVPEEYFDDPKLVWHGPYLRLPEHADEIDQSVVDNVILNENKSALLNALALGKQHVVKSQKDLAHLIKLEPRREFTAQEREEHKAKVRAEIAKHKAREVLI